MVDGPSLEKVQKAIVPGNIAGPTNHIFKGVGPRGIIRNGTGDGVVVVLKEFVGQNPLPVQPLQQSLGMNEDQHLAESTEHGTELLMRIHLKDSSHCLHRPRRMERRKNEVSGLGRFQTGIHGITVTDLPKEDDVRGLA